MKINIGAAVRIGDNGTLRFAKHNRRLHSAQRCVHTAWNDLTCLLIKGHAAPTSLDHSVSHGRPMCPNTWTILLATGLSLQRARVSTQKRSSSNILDNFARSFPMPDLKTQSVPSVERALRILEVLANSKRGLSLAQLIQSIGIPKSSAHCLLLTLERNGFLRRNEASGRYLFGLKLFSLATMAVERIELREQVLPLLVGLMKKTGLTVHMALLEHGDAVLIERVEAPGPFRLATWVGKRMGMHCTSLGKAIMAYLKPADLTILVKEHGLPRHNQNTIASMRELREELDEVRRHGYAVDDQEEEMGLRCVGAPIFDRDGVPIAAISLSGTTAQICPADLTRLGEEVTKIAQDVSWKLGFAG